MYKKRVISRLFCTLILLFSVTGLCFADWDPNDPYKMHYPQLPDCNDTGMDVLAGWKNVTKDPDPVLLETFLADDFRCTQDGLITEIHIWGSFNEDMILHDIAAPFDFVKFSLVIYSDIPADPEDPNSYSMPGEVLWETYMTPTAVRQYAIGNELFYDPDNNQVIGQDTICWQYNFEIPANRAFEQVAGTIYWLGIHYSLDVDGDEWANAADFIVFQQNYPGMFGWKTSLQHFNDGAVFTKGSSLGSDGHVAPVPQDPDEPFLITPAPWTEIRYPPGHEKEGDSIDLAFVIGGDPPAMPPDGDINKDGSVNLLDFALVAKLWLQSYYMDDLVILLSNWP